LVLVCVVDCSCLSVGVDCVCGVRHELCIVCIVEMEPLY
jgi:hypothetical protein